MKKTTRAIMRTAQASQGFLVLEVFPDLLVTKVGADFYIRQQRYVVDEIVNNGELDRTIYLRRPEDKDAKP